MYFYKSFKMVLIVSFVSFVLVGFCYAQMPGMLGANLPEMYGELKIPEVGTYVEYSIISKKDQDEEMIRFSIVGKEKTPEGEFYWYEVKTHNRNTGVTAIIKMLISGDPKDAGNTKRMIVKYNQEKAIELPGNVLAMSDIQKTSEEPIQAEKEEKIEELGKEKVKTPVGTFDCIHLRYEDVDKNNIDVWTSEKLSFFELVKFESKDRKLELTAYGEDAVSAITEKPEQIQIPTNMGEVGK